MHIAYLSLGSNLNDPISQVKKAMIEIENIPEVLEINAISSLFETPPIGPKQPNFINAAIKITTSLCAHDLLIKLQEIEQSHHRERLIHWGPRTLDIDILLFDDCNIKDEKLTIPHPFMQERAFVLVPLLEIEPHLITPQHGCLQTLLNRLKDRLDIQKITAENR